MALEKCKECDHEVSKKAKECPNCGAPVGAKQYSLGSLIILIIFGWFMYSLLSTDYISESTNSNSVASTKASEPQLEVLSWKCDTEHSYIFVRGEVKNISSKKLKNVVAVGEFRNKAGELVKTEDALLEYNPIMPGQTSPFKAGGTSNPQIENCNISFKYLFGTPVAYIVKKK